ncbi:MAG: hypothetical protein M1839_003642 [Geoglossum umbratile]|nr:MAG: hypothetical protein M1839_003642 [Geoglossum umbratile]
MSSDALSGVVPEQSTAALEVVEYEKLLGSSAAEQSKVLRACQNQGFFYLHLPRHEYRDLWAHARAMFAVAKEIFEQPPEKKQKFHMALSGSGETCGYKPLGYYSGIVKGNRDGFEQFKIPRVGILQLDPEFTYNRPEVVDRNWELLESLVNTIHSIGITILEALSTALGLPTDQRFEKFHGIDTLTNSMLGCNKHPKHRQTDPNIGHLSHTDTGSITILFTLQWGLQIFQPGTGKWEFIQPLPEHAVINVGDSLRHMSRNKLHSGLHRVVPAPEPGSIEQEDRYSFMYFLRPDRDTVFCDQDGNEYNAAQWHDLKTQNYRKDHTMISPSLQTGRKEYLGLWDAGN